MGRKPKIKEQVSFNTESEDTSKQPLSDKAENIENLKAEYKDIQEQKVRKPRTKKADKIEAEQFAIIANIQASIALDIIISRMPNSNPLTDKERESFDKAFTELINKYASYMNKFGIEIQFGIALILILIPRIDFKKLLNDRRRAVDSRQAGNGQDFAGKIVDPGIPSPENNNN